VIPLPDEEAGEVPKAFVVTNGLITSEEVTQFVAEHLAPYTKVRAVEIVEEIPKSAVWATNRQSARRAHGCFVSLRAAL
jgi:acyl-coenzyme A synthetase/AMP-(fatty) acid ligase